MKTQQTANEYHELQRQLSTPNKAQPRKQDAASHSPLPWSEKGGIITAGISPGQPYIADCRFGPLANREANAKLIVANVNHAGKLAEALRDVTTATEIVDGCETPDKSDIEHMLDCFEKAHKALAAWEGAQS